MPASASPLPRPAAPADPSGDLRDFVRRHGEGLAKLLMPVLGPVAREIVRELDDLAHGADPEACAHRLLELRDMLDDMLGRPEVTSESPAFDTALRWHIGRLTDLAAGCR
jgi:hypothetical protein